MLAFTLSAGRALPPGRNARDTISRIEKARGLHGKWHLEGRRRDGHEQAVEPLLVITIEPGSEDVVVRKIQRPHYSHHYGCKNGGSIVGR